MTDDSDRIHELLNASVQPLLPPPGTFERVRRRARRRKAQRALLAGAAAAVVIAGAAAAPALVAQLRPGPGRQRPAAEASLPTQPARSPSPAPSATPGSEATKSATQIPSSTGLSATTSGAAVPASFAPTSVTITGTGTGGLVGAVIGQAGTPGHCATRYCTSLAGTSTFGGSWYGVSAPLAPGPSGSRGVSQLRFASLQDGWAYGPALWDTADGGRTWQRQGTGGQRVIALEAAAGRAFAIFARCSGQGRDYAAGCTSFTLYSAAAGSGTWTQVPGAAQDLRAAGGGAAAASLVIASGTRADPGQPAGYLLAPSGAVLTGPLDGTAWHVAGQIPPACQTGAALRTGQPAGAQLAAGSATGTAAGSRLLLSCDASSGGAAVKTIYASPAGASWTQAGQASSTGRAAWLAAADDGVAVLATSTGMCFSADAGGSWASAKVADPPPGGFAYVGMTSPAVGIAVPADASLGEVYITRDGGRSWAPSPVTGTGSG